MKNKKLRFLIVLLITALVWIVLGAHVAGTQDWILTDSGGWVRIYPQPVEVIFLTLCAVVITTWLFRWYSRDRIERLVSKLDIVERHQLLDRLLDQHLRNAQSLPSEKRKRLADDGEIITDADDMLNGSDAADLRSGTNEPS